MNIPPFKLPNDYIEMLEYILENPSAHYNPNKEQYELIFVKESFLK